MALPRGALRRPKGLFSARTLSRKGTAKQPGTRQPTSTGARRARRCSPELTLARGELDAHASQKESRAVTQSRVTPGNERRIRRVNIGRTHWGWHDRRPAGTLPLDYHDWLTAAAPRPDDPPLVLHTARESDQPELRRLDEGVFQEVAYPGFLLRQLFDMCKEKSQLSRAGGQRTIACPAGPDPDARGRPKGGHRLRKAAGHPRIGSRVEAGCKCSTSVQHTGL